MRTPGFERTIFRKYDYDFWTDDQNRTRGGINDGNTDELVAYEEKPDARPAQ